MLLLLLLSCYGPKLMGDRLRSANILLVTMKSLANEVAKNLVLAGIGSLTVLDHESVTEEDLGAQFFVYEEHIGQNVCQHTHTVRERERERERANPGSVHKQPVPKSTA